MNRDFFRLHLFSHPTNEFLPVRLNRVLSVMYNNAGSLSSTRHLGNPVFYDSINSESDPINSVYGPERERTLPILPHSASSFYDPSSLSVHVQEIPGPTRWLPNTRTTPTAGISPCQLFRRTIASPHESLVQPTKSEFSNDALVNLLLTD